jgi:hypothetical protein
LFADKHPRIEKRAGGDNDSAATQSADAGLQTANCTVAEHEALRLTDEHIDAGLRQQLLKSRAIALPIRLHPRSLDRRALAPVKHAPVKRRSVRGACHETIEHIELAHQMALANSADGRITRHLADVLGSKRHQPHARTTPRGSRRGFAAGVPSTYDENIIHERRLAALRAQVNAPKCFT